MIKVGIIVPDRGDRPLLMQQCIRLIRKQEWKKCESLHLNVWDNPPKSDLCDITYRYRKSYETLCTADEGEIDVIAFMENDDYYAPDYLDTMVTEWDKAGRPDLFGTNFTIYYHLKLRKYFTMRHDQRASAMNTLIRPGLTFIWPQDHDPYTDQWLWMEPVSGIKSKKLFEPKKIISIGIKHGSSMTGGDTHTDNQHRFINDDKDMYWLEGIVDAESFQFYKQFSEKMISGEIKQVG